MSKLVDSWNPVDPLPAPRMYICPVPRTFPLISLFPSNPCIHAVLASVRHRNLPKSLVNRLVDAPVSTMALPYMHSLRSCLSMFVLVSPIASVVSLVCLGVVDARDSCFATIANVAFRPVGNSVFPTAGS